MKKCYLLLITCLLISMPLLAEEEHAGLVVSKAPINTGDIASIKRGGAFFARNCMSCHTLVYLKYDKLAQSVGITYDKMPIHITDWPNGIKPPDLSLEADIRGVDWIYTYLHSFYQDQTRPAGVNNLLVPGTAMPNILSPYQGMQVLVPHPAKDLWGQVRWYDLLKLTNEGSLKPDEFDEAMADVVNFLDYAAEPFKNEQHRIGYWVMGFLFFLFILMYLLKKEYWKDVKKKID